MIPVSANALDKIGLHENPAKLMVMPTKICLLFWKLPRRKKKTVRVNNN